MISEAGWKPGTSGGRPPREYFSFEVRPSRTNLFVLKACVKAYARKLGGNRFADLTERPSEAVSTEIGWFVA